MPLYVLPLIFTVVLVTYPINPADTFVEFITPMNDELLNDCEPATENETNPAGVI